MKVRVKRSQRCHYRTVDLRASRHRATATGKVPRSLSRAVIMRSRREKQASEYMLPHATCVHFSLCVCNDVSLTKNCTGEVQRGYTESRRDRSEELGETTAQTIIGSEEA